MSTAVPPDEEEEMLDAAEAGEEIQLDETEDHPMDSGSDAEDDGDDDDDNDQQGIEVELQNDSIAHFDAHGDSVFCIAAHPADPDIVATGSGDDSAYVFSVAAGAIKDPPSKGGRNSIPPLAHLTGHADSVSAIAFTLPAGDYLLTGGLDGHARVYDSKLSTPSSSPSPPPSFKLLAEAQEVPEIAWLAPCPHPRRPNCFALGASDGSVWVYAIVDAAPGASLRSLQAYYQHTGPSTAGTWSHGGSLLTSVSEDGSLYVFDPFDDAAAAGVSSSGLALVGLTAADQRFAVEGGLYSVAVAPGGAFLAAGGAGGLVRIVGLPTFAFPGSDPGVTAAAAASASNPVATKSQKGAGARSKAGAAKQGHASSGPSGGQAGQLLASLHAQTDGIEALAFSHPPVGTGTGTGTGSGSGGGGGGLNKASLLLATGSVDGSIALFDAAHGFVLRRHIRGAHGDQAVVQLSFREGSSSSSSSSSNNNNSSGGPARARPADWWELTSCGMDGVVRKWDARGTASSSAATTASIGGPTATATATASGPGIGAGGAADAGDRSRTGLLREWKGHRGGGEGGGVMGFVRGVGTIVTAGDDGVTLVFDDDGNATT